MSAFGEVRDSLGETGRSGTVRDSLDDTRRKFYQRLVKFVTVWMRVGEKCDSVW